MSDYRTPAQLIEAHLKTRGWSQRVLSIVLGVDATVISKILSGKKPVDAELALMLQAALGIDPAQLLDLQASYELAKAQIEIRIDPRLPIRAAVFGGLPLPR